MRARIKPTAETVQPIAPVLYRLQNEAGVGPFAAGAFVGRRRPSVFDQCPGAADAVQNLISNGVSVGCAAFGKSGLIDWFGDELPRLIGAGFRVVDCTGLYLVAAGDDDAIVASRLPLSKLLEVRL